jgi:hypothetical protein
MMSSGAISPNRYQASETSATTTDIAAHGDRNAASAAVNATLRAASRRSDGRST